MCDMESAWAAASTRAIRATFKLLFCLHPCLHLHYKLHSEDNLGICDCNTLYIQVKTLIKAQRTVHMLS